MKSGSSTTTSDVWHSGWMPEKLHNTSRSRNCTKKGYGDCLVVCGRSHSSQHLESGRNDYGGEVMPINWRNAPEAPTYMPEIGQYEGTNSPLWQCSPACCSTDPAKAEWIGLRNSASCAIFTRPLVHRLSLFQASRQLPVRKMLQKPRWCQLAFNDFIASRTPDFYANGINKLVSHWQKCDDSNGSYFD